MFARDLDDRVALLADQGEYLLQSGREGRQEVALASAGCGLLLALDLAGCLPGLRTGSGAPDAAVATAAALMGALVAGDDGTPLWERAVGVAAVAVGLFGVAHAAAIVPWGLPVAGVPVAGVLGAFLLEAVGPV